MTLMGSYCFRRFHDKQSFPSEEGTLVLTMKVPSALRKGGNLAAHCHGGREKIVQAVSFLSYFVNIASSWLFFDIHGLLDV